MTSTPPMAVKQMSKCSPAWRKATVVRERVCLVRARSLGRCLPVLYRQLLRLPPVAMVTALQQP